MERTIEQITAPWAGTLIGSVVIALGAVVVLLAIFLWRSWQNHLAEVKACNAQMMSLTQGKIESDNKIANALEGLEKIVDAALSALKRQ